MATDLVNVDTSILLALLFPLCSGGPFTPVAADTGVGRLNCKNTVTCALTHTYYPSVSPPPTLQALSPRCTGSS